MQPTAHACLMEPGQLSRTPRRWLGMQFLHDCSVSLPDAARTGQSGRPTPSSICPLSGVSSAPAGRAPLISLQQRFESSVQLAYVANRALTLPSLAHADRAKYLGPFSEGSTPSYLKVCLGMSFTDE
jgi:hypothetical protein